MKKRIRTVELSDAGAVRNIYGPFVLENATSFETELPDLETIECRIRNLKDLYPWLVFEADGKVLGYAYASSHRTRQAYQWSVEVSVYIHDSARQCGIGRALYLALLELLRRQGYVNAYAAITLPNPASLGLHESLGFTEIGVFCRIGFKLGRWHDVVWLQLRLLEPQEPMQKPFPVRDVMDSQVERLFEQHAQAVRYGVIQ